MGVLIGKFWGYLRSPLIHRFMSARACVDGYFRKIKEDIYKTKQSHVLIVPGF